MTNLEMAMAALIKVFHENAGQDKKLNKAELKGLLQTEFKGMLGNAPPGAADEIFNGLDQDGSGSVNFQEFVNMVASVACVTNEMIFQQ
ncbi:protein S100-A1-like [Engraulis encrasicolus]|uniref:protein S100-A1-like n=1 Tax=Engraulis encrasicolus TaxID=184585 RepID=UPI002FCFC2A3